MKSELFANHAVILYKIDNLQHLKERVTSNDFDEDKYESYRPKLSDY